MSFPDSRRWC